MKNFRYKIIALLLFGLTSCSEDFLERYPLDETSPETFFNNEQDLKTYTNSFYTYVPDWSDIYNNNYADDEARFKVTSEIRGTRVAPTSGGGWTWGQLREINFFLDNVDKFDGDVNIKNHYVGLAKFFRAWVYLDKVKRFGDVPWYSTALSDDDEALYKARDSRFEVMDSILVDIDYAIKHLKESPSATRITKWTALALKSRLTLYEGTFRKYHELTGYEKMLKESVSASKALMDYGEYGIYKSTPNNAYHELFVAKDAITEEIILKKEYNFDVKYTHGVDFRTNSSSYGRPGVKKQVINSYLMRDGSRFTDIPNYNKKQYYEEMQNRDPRLSQTIITPGYKRLGETKNTVPNFSATLTGYQYIKYIKDPSYYNSGSDIDLPVMRFAETLLNYAEAKAELGTLTQDDLDESISKIRDRVNMPPMDITDANNNPDSFLEDQYPDVSGPNKGVILEIRRERRVELIREGFRWDDLMRWKAGQLLTRTSYGMYFPGVGEYDLDKNGTTDLIIYQGNRPSGGSGVQVYALDDLHLKNQTEGRMVINGDVQKNWNEFKDYLYPIPLQELTVNPNLEQNPGW